MSDMINIFVIVFLFVILFYILYTSHSNAPESNKPTKRTNRLLSNESFTDMIDSAYSSMTDNDTNNNYEWQLQNQINDEVTNGDSMIDNDVQRTQSQIEDIKGFGGIADQAYAKFNSDPTFVADNSKWNVDDYMPGDHKGKFDDPHESYKIDGKHVINLNRIADINPITSSRKNNLLRDNREQPPIAKCAAPMFNASSWEPTHTMSKLQ